MATVLITGGTGLIGKTLTNALREKGYEIIVLTRKTDLNSQDLSSPVKYAHWSVKDHIIDEAAISKADYIIHLAGAGVADKRWTPKRKQEIADSRVMSGRLIADSLKKIPNHVKAVVCASAIGWYGPDPAIPNPRPFDENDPADGSFLGITCKKWEESSDAMKQLGKRLVKLRIGIVLSQNGGALTEFIKPLRFGIAAILGSGKQVISWIHIDDLVRLFITAMEGEKMNGVYNAVAPQPVSNKEFTLQLARIKKGKLFIPLHVPAFVLKWILGEMSIEVLKSATVSSAKLQIEGFSFLYSSLDKALLQLTTSR